MPSNSILSTNVTTDLTAEPVAIAEFKEYAHITYTDDDVQLTAILKSARLLLEKYCQVKFGVATVSIEFTHSGNRPILLTPMLATAITALSHRPCRLQPFTDKLEAGTWELENGRFFGDEGHYKATYTTAFTITEDVKTAIKAQALFMWENKVDASKQMVIAPYAVGLISNIRYIC